VLHSRFITLDRAKKERDIIDFSKSTNNGLWITTQLVEASLDIDFDLLLTECSTIDSMLQRFGRCYRKRHYNNTDPNIFIFQYDNISKKIYDPELINRTYKTLSEYNNLLITEEQKQEMIDKVFTDIEHTEYFHSYKNYKDLLKSGFRANKKEAQELFRNITNQCTVIPKPVYEKNKDLINDLVSQIDSNKGIEKLKVKEKLYDYCANLKILGRQRLLKLEDFPIKSKFLLNNNIKLLDGIQYNDKKGIVFIENSENIDNII